MKLNYFSLMQKKILPLFFSFWIGISFFQDEKLRSSRYLLAPPTQFDPTDSINFWETLIEGENLFRPGELRAKVIAIRKALPWVRKALRQRLKINPEEIAAVYATGDYILLPTFGKARTLYTIKDLDFIVFLKKTPAQGTVVRIEEFEIDPSYFFSAEDPDYGSSAHMNITVTSYSNPFSTIIARAYYLGALIYGEAPWKDEPEYSSLLYLIKELFQEIKKTSTDTLVVGAKIPIICLLIKKVVPIRTLKRIVNHRCHFEPPMRDFLHRVFPDLNLDPLLYMEASVV